MIPQQIRIVGGRPTVITKHPWQVSLQAYDYHYCGGTIISSNLILTAGHCTTYPINLIKVRVGTNNSSCCGSVHDVVKLIRHKNFTTSRRGVPSNDIAVLVLNNSISLNSKAWPIKLFDQDEKAPIGTYGTLTGWGSMVENGDKPNILRTVDVAIVSKVDCELSYKDWGGIPKGQICAMDPVGGKDSCTGDSGGPLVIRGRQTGIVSWGNGCARMGYPGVYTEIAYFRHWLNENVGI